LNTTVTDGNYVFVDRTGKIVLRTDLFYAYPFSEGLALGFGASTNKWGYVDKTGKMAIPAIYDSAESFSEGLAAVGQSEDKKPTRKAPPK
jgi:hypothetical protein